MMQYTYRIYKLVTIFIITTVLTLSVTDSTYGMLRRLFSFETASKHSSKDMARQWKDLKKYLNVPSLTKVNGKGVKVAIVDSGVYDHGGFLGKLTGDLGDTVGHGTHVAGSISQMAPGAELVSYKVEMDKNDCLDDVDLYQKLRQAIDDKVDVINLSLFSDTPKFKLFDLIREAQEKGIMVVAIAGNQGLEGPVSPGNFPGVLSVGASTLPIKLPRGLVKGSTSKFIVNPKTTSSILLEEVGPLVDLRRRDHLKGGGNLRGSVVLYEPLKEEEIVSELRSLKNQGVKAVLGIPKMELLYTSEENRRDFERDMGGSELPPTAWISEDDGLVLRELVDQEGNPHIQFVNGEKRIVMTDFSSRGPSVYGMVKPDLVAPGCDVISYCPHDEYNKMSGTSMSAPIVSGAVALLKERHPDWTIKQIVSVICTRAVPLKDYSKKPYSPYFQGSGLLNVDASFKSETFVHPHNLSFVVDAKKTGCVNEYQELTIENTSNERKTYTLCVDEDLEGVTLVFPESVTVEARNAVTIDIKTIIDVERCPKFQAGSNAKLPSSRIYIECNGEKMNIPFVCGKTAQKYRK